MLIVQGQKSIDAALLGSRSDTRVIVLTSGLGSISQNPNRIGLVIYSPANDTVRITPGMPAGLGFGGIVLSPNDWPLVLRLRDYGDAVREGFALDGTGSDSILITEIIGCQCNQ